MSRRAALFFTKQTCHPGRALWSALLCKGFSWPFLPHKSISWDKVPVELCSYLQMFSVSSYSPDAHPDYMSYWRTIFSFSHSLPVRRPVQFYIQYLTTSSFRPKKICNWKHQLDCTAYETPWSDSAHHVHRGLIASSGTAAQDLPWLLPAHKSFNSSITEKADNAWASSSVNKKTWTHIPGWAL